MSQNTFACLSLIWAEVRQVAYAPSIHRMLTWHCVIKSWVSKTEKHKWIYSLSYKKILSSKGHTEIYIQRKNSISVSVFHPDSYVQIFPDSLYPLMRLWAGDAQNSRLLRVAGLFVLMVFHEVAIVSSALLVKAFGGYRSRTQSWSPVTKKSLWLR